MDRRECLKHLARATLSLGVAGCAAEPARRPPNFVFILADDLGWSDAGCYGSTFHETPGIDRLAASGMRFTDAYAASSVCSPTRASILTGKHPARLNLTDWIPGRQASRGVDPSEKFVSPEFRQQLPLEEVTVAEALKQAGYMTFFAGKWHLGGEGFYPEMQGFDGNRAGFELGWPRGGYFSPYDNPKLGNGPEGEYLTDRLTDEALAFLEANSDRPFFLNLWYYTVHNPMQGKPELVSKYQAKAAALPDPEGPRFQPEGPLQARQVQDHPVYAAMVQSLDENVGRILDRLDRLGLARNTIVIFMSDNGGLSTSEGSPTSNLPLRAGKGWLYEGGIREPMIIRWPGVTRPGSTCSVPVISTDFFPTMLEMAGLEAMPDQHRDGLSLVPLLRQQDSLSRQALYWYYPHYSNQARRPDAAVRAGDFKLVKILEEDRLELYNLAEDIGERNDLSSARPEKAAQLHSMLLEWLRSVDARRPSPNPDYDPRAPRPEK